MGRRSLTRVKNEHGDASTGARTGGMASSSSKRAAVLIPEDEELDELDKSESEESDFDSSSQGNKKKGTKKGGKSKEPSKKGKGSKEVKDDGKPKKGAKAEKPDKKAKPAAKAEKPDAKAEAKGEKAKPKGKAKDGDKAEPVPAAKAKPKEAKKGNLDEEEPSAGQKKGADADAADEDVEEEVDMDDEDDGDDDGVPVELDGAKGEILKYMKSTNRPYSFINIMDNTRGVYKKKQLEKILDDLEAEGHLRAKLYGKAKIYYYNQRLFPQVDEDKLLAMGVEMKELEDGLKAHKDALKQSQAEVRRLDKLQSTNDMRDEIEALKKKLESMDQELVKYKTEVKLVDDKDLQVLEKARDRMQLESRRRNKVLKDVLDLVAEALEVKVPEARNRLGLD